MIKLVFALRRAPHLSREAFQTYWREQHAPLVEKHRAALGIRRYVQVHTLDSPVGDAIAASRGAPEPYDGVAELWFDDLESLAAPPGPDAIAAGRALLEDERRFIDLARSPIWLAREHEVIAPSPPAPKPESA